MVTAHQKFNLDLYIWLLICDQLEIMRNYFITRGVLFELYCFDLLVVEFNLLVW
jgi:hypothetical protein